MKAAAVVSALMLLWGPTANAQQRPMWITAYYPWWTYVQMKPSELDYTAMTHLVIFSANPVTTPPYLDVLVNPHDSANVVNGLDCGIPSDYLAQTISSAHAKGVKVLLSVGGIYGAGAQNMSYIARDDGRVRTFVGAACAFAHRWEFDGIELDWEVPHAGERARYVQLISAFRQELDRWHVRGLFITAVNHTPWRSLGYDSEAMTAAFDQVNPMTYEMHYGDYQNPRTGYNSPIERSTEYPASNGYAINQQGFGPKAWLDFGIPPAKLGLSIAFTTTEFSGVEAPVEPGRPYKKASWGYIRDIPRRGRHWDRSAHVPWEASGTTMISFDDTASCRIKVEYAQALHIGGIMIYELSGGYIPSAEAGKRDLLLTYIARCVRSTGPPLGDITHSPSVDTTPPIVRITSPRAGATVNGTVRFSAEAFDDVGVMSVLFTVDGRNIGQELTDPPYTSAPLQTWLIGNGTHTLKVIAKDDASNAGTATCEFTVKNRGPKPDYKDLVLYDDKLCEPFTDVSWGVKADYANTRPVRSGSASIKVEYAPWGALWLQNGKNGEEKEIDPLLYTSLNFDAYPLEDFTMKVVFSNGVTVEVPLKGNQWNPVEVPLTSAQPFKSVYLRRDLAGTAVVYYDNIRFTAAKAR